MEPSPSNGTAWEFGVLGALTLKRDGREVPLAGRLPRALLALLVMHRGRPRNVEQLIDELWPAAQPASANASFHVHLSKVRALVGDLLVRSAAGYALDQAGFALDADRFASLLSESRRRPDETRRLLTEALRLWRGEPLADLAPDGPLADWVRALLEQHLTAIQLRIDCDLASGDGAEVVAELERLVAANPYEEPLWRRLMLALYQAGRQADALRAFDRARRVLADELGLTPGEQLARVHQQILAQDPDLTAVRAEATRPATRPAPPPVAARSTPERGTAAQISLPRPTTRLVGRETALGELDRLVSDPFCRLLTLTGLGGVGKTRLAIAHAASWGASFADGVVFAGLARLTDHRQVRAEIASAIARRSDAAEPNELTLMRHLAGRELLLVLDSFEHVLGAAPVVAELLEAAPGLKVLVSSRIPLRLRGEQRMEVEPLAVEAADDPTGGPAVALFVQGARAVNYNFAPDASELTTIAGICRALDGLPLAIELAAARSARLSPAAIAAAIAQPLTFGRGALRDLPERHQTLEAAISWSYELLSPDARHALRAASVFVGPFTLESLSAVCDRDATAALHELLEASLLKDSSVTGRFRLLDLVRTFARARRTEAGEDAAVSARLRSDLLARFADVAADQHPSDPGETALTMAPDHADIRSAIAGAILAGDAAAAVTLAMALQPIWMAGQLEEAGAIVDSVLDAFTVSADDELNLLRMASFANSYRTSNKYWAQRRVRRAGELGQVSPQVSGLSNMIAQALCRRDAAEALELRGQLLPVYETAELRPRVRSAALSMLSCCAYAEGDYAAATEHGAASLAAAAGDGHPHMLTVARGMYVLALSAYGGALPLDEVIALVEGALALQLPDLSISSLWFAARYAVGFDPEAAAPWLVQGQRVLTEIDGELWPESQLRDETLAVLGVSDVGPLLERTPQQSTLEALNDALAWLQGRDATERAPRTDIAPPLAANPDTAVSRFDTLHNHA